MLGDEAIEMYQELRREGLYPEEAAELTDELMGETYAKGGSALGSVCMLLGMLLCIVLTIGGL